MYFTILGVADEQGGSIADSVRTSLEFQRVDDSEDARLLDTDVELGVIDRTSGAFALSTDIE